MRSETTLQRVLQDDVDAQLVRMEMFLELLGRMFAVSAPYASSASFTLLLASMLKIQQSGKAVRLLAQEELVEEILAVGRTLVEVVVNVCYLQGADRQELERYLSYHPEVQHRYASMLGPVSRAGGRGLMAKVGEFVSSMLPAARSQRADADWTQRSLAQRAQLSDERSNVPVMAPLLSRCFPRGEAAVHGTVGSLRCFVEAVQSQQMPAPQDRYRELSEALFGVNLTLMSFSLFLDESLHLGMHQAIDQISAADSSAKPDLISR